MNSSANISEPIFKQTRLNATTLQKMCLKTNALWVRDFVPPHSHARGSADGNLWRSKWPPSPLWSSMSRRTAPCPAALMPVSPCLATPRPRWWCALFFFFELKKITLEVEKFRLQSFPFPFFFSRERNPAFSAEVLNSSVPGQG